MSQTPPIDIILSEAELMQRVDALAERLAPQLAGEWTAVTILIGATPFTTDLLKALARRDIHPVL
ncbi:MAG: hypoxanthine phosphoribosyltransferase, partial [Pseudomonadota bacterium]